MAYPGTIPTSPGVKDAEHPIRCDIGMQAPTGLTSRTDISDALESSEPAADHHLA